MKLLFGLIFVTLFLFNLSVAWSEPPVPSWIKLLRTSDSDVAADLTTDSMGNLYVAGRTKGNLNGEINGGNWDAFIVRYDLSGELQWTKLLSTSDVDVATALTTDSMGNLYVAGVTKGNLNGETNNGNRDAFIVKYDLAGARLWTKLLGTIGNDSANALIADSLGNLYVAGRTDGDLNGEKNNGYPDAFIVKYDSTGVLQWTKLLGSSRVDMANALTIDGSDNVYVAGSTNGDLNGKINSSLTDSDAFIVKY